MDIVDIPIPRLQQMAAAAHREGDFGQAKSLYVCLIAANRFKYGARSDQVAAHFYKLAEVYADVGDYDGAQTLFRRAIEIWQESHPECLLSDCMMRLQAFADKAQSVEESCESDRNQDVA